MHILNISGYKFTPLAHLAASRACLLAQGRTLDLRGTVLLSHEGININLAGSVDNINSFKNFLKNDLSLSDIHFKESYSCKQPFKNLKIKLKEEIISFRQPCIDPVANSAPTISPEIFKKWLDDDKDITLLDTRNDYEVKFGTFKNAKNLFLKNFTDFPRAIQNLPSNKPVVMFCTGGIRCEKAALFMLKQGFSNVYQLEGGILNYFSQVGATHYEGECFVFDERISVDSALGLVTETKL